MMRDSGDLLDLLSSAANDGKDDEKDENDDAKNNCRDFRLTFKT